VEKNSARKKLKQQHDGGLKGGSRSETGDGVLWEDKRPLRGIRGKEEKRIHAKVKYSLNLGKPIIANIPKTKKGTQTLGARGKGKRSQFFLKTLRGRHQRMGRGFL